MLLDEVSVRVASLELRMREHADEERAVGADPLHAQRAERADHLLDGLGARGGVRDDLGQHRVVVDADLGARLDAAVDAQPVERR